MKSAALLLFHILVITGKILRPGGFRAIIAENLMLKQQLIVIARSRKKAPNLKTTDRFIFGWLSLLLHPARISKVAVIIKPATIMKFHRALTKRKYQQLFNPISHKKPGPKGPSQTLISAIVELKRRNPRYGCPRIAQIITHRFGIGIDKDVVRRVLAKHYTHHPGGNNGPSWLSFIGHMKDSLWSIDLFRCESLTLKSHWVLVIMDQWSRRIIGFGVHRGPVDGIALCRMFNRAIAGLDPPHYLSSDNDPLFRFRRWQANLRVLDIKEIKTIPYTPVSHPFVERLIGTIRREYLDHVPFWNSIDLERKLTEFKEYYNQHRVHASISGHTPAEHCGECLKTKPDINNYAWMLHCRGLFQTPMTA